MDIEKINGFYLEENFAELKSYLEAHRDNDLASYYYHSGLVTYKEGQVADARWFFEKAYLEGQIGSSVTHNISVVKKELGLENIESYGQMNSIVMALQGELFLTVFLGFLCLTLFCWWRRAYRAVMALGPILLVSLCLKFFYIDSLHYSISLQETPLREGPSKLFEKSSTLPAGLKVLVGKEKDDWFFVIAPESFVGWVEKQGLKSLRD